MKLIEIGSTKIDNLVWHSNGRFLLCSFLYNNIQYSTVQIEKKPILEIPELHNKKTAEVSFHLTNEQNSDKAHSTTSIHKMSYQIYSVVMNALNEKFANYDAYEFVAYKRHSKDTAEWEQKKNIYFYYADKLAKDNSNTEIYEYDDASKAQFIVSRIKIVSNKFKNMRKLANGEFLRTYIPHKIIK